MALTVVQELGQDNSNSQQQQKEVEEQEDPHSLWVLAVDISYCRAVQSSGVHPATGEPRFVAYPPDQQRTGRYAAPFYIVQSTSGAVTAVYHPRDEDLATLHFKQGVASALHASLRPSAAQYSQREVDETGLYTAEYSVEATGARGLRDAQLVHHEEAGARRAAEASHAAATHRVVKHAGDGAFIALADSRASTRQLKLVKTSTLHIDAAAGVVTSVRTTFDATARDHETPQHLQGDFELRGANSPASHVTGVLRLTALGHEHAAHVASRRLHVASPEQPLAAPLSGDTPKQAHVDSGTWLTPAEVAAAAAAATPAEAPSDAPEDEETAEEPERQPVMLLVRGSLLTTGHARTYTGDGGLVRDSVAVDGEGDIPLKLLMACLDNAILNDGADPRGFSFNARQVKQTDTHTLLSRS